jgi:hypothetical protein
LTGIGTAGSSFEEPPGEGEVFAIGDTFRELLAVLDEPPPQAASMSAIKKAAERRTEDFIVRKV